MGTEQFIVTILGGAAHAGFVYLAWGIPWSVLALSYFVLWMTLILPHSLLQFFLHEDELALELATVLSIWWLTFALSGIVGGWIASRLFHVTGKGWAEG